MCEYACIDFDSFKSQGALRLSVVKPKPINYNGQLDEREIPLRANDSWK